MSTRARTQRRGTARGEGPFPSERRVARGALQSRRLRCGALFLAAAALGFLLREDALHHLAAKVPGPFALRSLEVAGLDTVPDATLRALVGDIAGRSGREVDPNAVEAALRAHPRIAHVEVSRALPGRLLVWGRERVAAAYVLADGTLLWVDSEGRPFARRADDGIDPAALPLLVPDRGVTEGRREAELASALGTVAQLRHAGFSVAAWHASGPEGTGPVVHLEGATGPLVLGDADLALQVRRLARALALREVREAGAIDLRFGERVIFWPAAPDVAAAGKRVSSGG